MNRLPDNMLGLMLKGDSRCPIPLGRKVKLIKKEEEDSHPLGAEGTVIGNFYLVAEGSAYLVHFAGDPLDEISYVDGDLLELC